MIFQINNIAWVAQKNMISVAKSQSDTRKCWELFNEFLYYIFDSLLIPLIRSNFYVTESNTHRYKLLFFRHDVWRAIAEPTLTGLKSTMFVELEAKIAQKILSTRNLGFSNIRLLPKANGVRPIMNLRRRTQQQGSSGALGRSINSILAPVFNMLSYEKVNIPIDLF